jgi:hypothetical protein
MYARINSNGVYHLLDPTDDWTLCGLKVTQVVINRPVETSILHLTDTRPPESELCGDCLEVKGETPGEDPPD